MLPSPCRLSAHKPLLFARRSGAQASERGTVRPIPPTLVDHPDFRRLVLQEYEREAILNPHALALDKLCIVKLAMRRACKSLGRSSATNVASSAEDKLHASMGPLL